MQGQINRGSKLEEYIFELTKKPEVKTIVDIGTWNGMGSTKCVLDGVLSSKISKEVISLECNKMRYEEAKTNLGFLPPNFKLIHGTLINADELYPILEKLENETYKKWIQEDINWIKVIPNVFHLMPEKIDLLIVDGGEFSGEIEFFKLYERCKYIVLDDTTTNKNKKSREFILANPDKFSIIEDDLINRNGFLVTKRK